MHQYLVTAATTIAQRAGIEALTNGQDDAQVMKAAYAKRRDFVYQALLDMGFDVARPDGAFYLLPKSRSNWGLIRDNSRNRLPQSRNLR